LNESTKREIGAKEWHEEMKKKNRVEGLRRRKMD